MATKEDAIKSYEDFKVSLKAKWRKKGRIERVCWMLMSGIVTPWLFGLVVACLTVSAEAGNMVMMFRFLMYTVLVAAPIVGVGCLMEFIREDKEWWERMRKGES